MTWMNSWFNNSDGDLSDGALRELRSRLIEPWSSLNGWYVFLFFSSIICLRFIAVPFHLWSLDYNSVFVCGSFDEIYGYFYFIFVFHLWIRKTNYS